MANPNIAASSATLYKEGYTQALTTSDATVHANAAGSGVVIELTDIMVGNIDGTNDANFILKTQRAAGTVTVASSVTVAAGGIVSLEKKITLLEGESLRMQANANNDLAVDFSVNKYGA